MCEKSFRQSIDARLSGLEVSQGRQAAILRRALQRERPAPRKPLVTLALAIALMALAAAGLAVVLRFGVISYNRGQRDNAAFKAHILTVNQAYETDDFSLTVNEAVFDGMSLSFTMNILPKAGGEPVYIHPRVSAQCDGRPLLTDPESCLGDFFSGFWVPERDPLGPEGTYGADYVILEEDGDGVAERATAIRPVTWTLSFDVIKPNWPVQANETELNGEDDPPFAEYMALFSNAYAARQILLAGGYSLVEYAAALPVPQGVTQEEWVSTRLSEQLVQSGAFSRVDTLEICFTTAEAAVKQLAAPQNFSLGARARVCVHSARATFTQAVYELTVRAPDAASAEEWYFAVLSPDCQTGESVMRREADGDGALRISGTASLFGEASALTFVPCRDLRSANEVYAQQQPLTDEQRALSFTIHLE